MSSSYYHYTVLAIFAVIIFHFADLHTQALPHKGFGAGGKGMSLHDPIRAERLTGLRQSAERDEARPTPPAPSTAL